MSFLYKCDHISLSFSDIYPRQIIFTNSSSSLLLSIPPPPYFYQFLYLLIFINFSSFPNLSIPLPRSVGLFLIGYNRKYLQGLKRKFGRNFHQIGRFRKKKTKEKRKKKEGKQHPSFFDFNNSSFSLFLSIPLPPYFY